MIRKFICINIIAANVKKVSSWVTKGWPYTQLKVGINQVLSRYQQVMSRLDGIMGVANLPTKETTEHTQQ